MYIPLWVIILIIIICCCCRGGGGGQARNYDNDVIDVEGKVD